MGWRRHRGATASNDVNGVGCQARGCRVFPSCSQCPFKPINFGGKGVRRVRRLAVRPFQVPFACQGGEDSNAVDAFVGGGTVRRAICGVASDPYRGWESACGVADLVVLFRCFYRVPSGRSRDCGARNDGRWLSRCFRARDRTIVFYGVSVGPVYCTSALVPMRVNLCRCLCCLISGRGYGSSGGERLPLNR